MYREAIETAEPDPHPVELGRASLYGEW